MKKIIVLTITAMLLFSCASWFTNPETGEPFVPKPVMNFTVNTVGFSIGIAAADLQPEVDQSLRDMYTLASEGRLELNALNMLIDSLLQSDDVAKKALANRLVKLTQMLGALVVGGQIVNIDQLDPEAMKELADGYVEGYNLAKKPE